jgi:hypothetical protein
MLNFTYTDGWKTLVKVSAEFSADAFNRNDFKTLETAEKVAADATALTGNLHIAVDQGPSWSPRYDVIEAPRVGAEVSYGFNGDYYPAGKITKISASLRRVQTDRGDVFFRRGQTAAWVKNGTWSMVQGTINRRNPEF